MLKKANQLQYNELYEEAIKVYDEFLNTHPDRNNLIAALYNKAQALDAINQFAKAAQCYQKIIDIDPNHMKGELFWEQGQLYQRARMHSECSKAYKQYLTRFPSHSECSFNLGIALQTLGQLEESSHYFQKAYQTKKGYIKAYKAQISVLKKLNKQEEIQKICNEALRYEPTDFQIHYESGMASFKLARFRQAESAFRESINANKKFVRGYISLGEVSYKLEKDKEGLEILQRCLKENKDVMKNTELKEINVCIGIIRMNLKDYKEAIRCFSLALSQPPASQNIKLKLAFCLEEEGNISFSRKNFSDALQCYNQALKYDQKRITLLNNIGLAYQNINNFDEAQKYFKKVLSLQPGNLTALNNLGALEHLRGNQKQAQQIFQKITQSNPQNYEGHINKGKQFMLKHKYKEALEQFKKVQKKQNNNFRLYNDMAVALQELGLYEEALNYANLANKFTQHRSPLLLLNRASIYMHLKNINDAKMDLDRASRQMSNPDKSYMIKLGVTQQNLKFIFNQLNHYAYLMNPINVFREGLAKEVQNRSQLKQKEIYNVIVQKIVKAQTFALQQVMTEIKKQKQLTKDTVIDPQKASMDRTTIQRWIDDAKNMMGTIRLQLQQQGRQITQLRMQNQMIKRQSQQFQEMVKQKLRYLPQSYELKSKLQSLYQSGDTAIWQYGKQLYWILNGYLKGYMLVQSGVVGKGENIDRSTFSSALNKIRGILQFSQNIPIISEFSQLISNVCGVFVDMQDEVIIKKMYQIISFNYDTQQDLNDAICNTVLLYLNDPNKIRKIRNNMVFDPPKGFLEKLKHKIESVGEWFQEKKNEFITHMRGYEKAQNIIQSQLAVIDVGVLVSIMLNFESNSQIKIPAVTNAAKKALVDCQLQEMICEAYERENENIRVSTNSFCLVMKCQINYDNVLLNDGDLMDYASHLGSNALLKILNSDDELREVLLSLWQGKRMSQIKMLLE